MSQNETEVAVIGGGAAGVAAAHRLDAAGVPALIIEARERLGGRAFTAHVGGYPLDYGCGWLHSADHNPWVTIARAQGRQIDDTRPPWRRLIKQPNFPREQQEEFFAAMQAFHDRMSEMVKSGQDAVASVALEPNGRWNGLLSAIHSYISGAEPDRLSIIDFDRYEDSNVNWRVAEGYGAVVAEHGAHIPVVFNAPVTRIDHSGKRIKIETGKGRIAADHVIVTLPSAVIAENESLFAPALPEKTDAARGLPLGLADKLFIALERPEEFEADTRLFGRTDRAAMATYHLRPFGRPVIEAYFGGRNASALEQGGERAFYDFAVAELTGLLGGDFARRIKPIGMHLWQVDPFARGSYSYALPGKADCRARLAAAVDERLFFAGEATSPDYFSTAHGAFFSGIAAAAAVIAARGN